MATVKTIAIIGASGQTGSAIAKSLSKTDDCRLLLMSHKPGKLVELKSVIEKSSPYTEVFILSCARDASWEADIIILAAPYEVQKEIAVKIREVSTGKIVISVSSPLNDSHNGFVAQTDISAAEELQRLLPDAKVVKMFNTAFAAGFTTSVFNGKRADAFIAGNNGDAIKTVSEIVEIAGFNPVWAGGLRASRTLERMQLLLTQLSPKHKLQRAGGL